MVDSPAVGMQLNPKIVTNSHANVRISFEILGQSIFICEIYIKLTIIFVIRGLCLGTFC